MIRLPGAVGQQASLLPDLTPLLDVLFIVLVFFLLTAQPALLELPLQLPSTQEALSPAAARGERMHVQLDAAGQWRLNDAPQGDFTELRHGLQAVFAADPSRGLDLALDRQAPLSAFLDLMALLQQQGIQDSRILLEPAP
ncbi:hypothetical protein HP532_01320 [Pseudomonas sp. CrR25]|nr:hypothetical protein [Pseudomonas sp. CrR25]